MIIWGVDYGSKLAGTTVIAQMDTINRTVELFQSEKKKDADVFLQQYFELHNPTWIGLDAPLSVPGKYRNLEGCDDFMFRQCDRALNAMSPMFLGGLTARAMRLTESFKGADCQVLEVYPGGLVKELFPDVVGYKQKESLEKWIPILQNIFSDTNLPDPMNWHQFDALLALNCVTRYLNGQSKAYGSPVEGQIFI